MRPRGFPSNSPLKVIFAGEAEAALEGVLRRERRGRGDAHDSRRRSGNGGGGNAGKNFEFF